MQKKQIEDQNIVQQRIKERKIGERKAKKGETHQQFLDRIELENKKWDEWTNQILVHNCNNFKGFKEKTILVPIYTKLIIKRLKNFKMNEGNGILLFTQLIWINCKQGPQEIIDMLLNDKIGLKCRRGFSKETSITSENATIKNKDGFISITIRDEVDVSLEGYLFNFPFTEFYASFHFELSQMSVDINREQYTVRFLFHQNEETSNMIIAKDALKEQFDFKVAFNKQKALFPIDKKTNSEHKELTLNFYSVADYKIALYQEPIGIIFTIYLPILVLSMICISIFASSHDLTGRISSIATLALAYIAFIPTVRSIIPSVPYLTFGDYLIQFNLAGCLLLLLSSYFSDRWGITDFTEEMNDSSLSALFVLTSCLFGFPFVAVFYKTLHFYLFKRQEFLYVKQLASSQNSQEKTRDAKKTGSDFDYENWFRPKIYEIADPSHIQTWSQYQNKIKIENKIY